ncbi:MAG: glutamate dehydrogenase, partial [Gammaproteobacteria bacterium]|nr:glutamate dehydrogenase [Gammaproteobacteria bacterium]
SRCADHIEGKTCLVSGSGNVATYTAEKITDLGGIVVTMSDSSGFVYDKDGIDEEKLEFIIDLKVNRRGRMSEYAEEYGVPFYADERPWRVPGELVFPCATQNELSASDADVLISNGCIAVAEGANMPVEQKGVEKFVAADILFAPSKAANAGGVAISGLEMSQNSIRRTWDVNEVHQSLREIMNNIHEQCVEYGAQADSDHIDYVKGANIAGFIKVANAMVAYGAV